MQVDLKIRSDVDCLNSVYGSDIDSKKQVCAGDGTGKDTCQGDSGKMIIFYITHLRNELREREKNIFFL